MNSYTNNRKSSRRGRGKKNKHNMMQDFAAPILRKIERQMLDITVTSSAQIVSGAGGTNGILNNFTFASFGDLTQLTQEFQYFEITGYKLDFSLSATANALDSFYAGAITYRPINYVAGEAYSSSLPISAQQVMELPGAIFVQDGASNRGKWCPPTCKQVYSTAGAITGANPAGQIVAYFDDIGVSESVGDAIVYLNVRLYGRQYSIST